MDWKYLYSTQRTGPLSSTTRTEPRTDFQRDYDRIIFSSPFRRLQNKTQVFPLPASIFVHNRLTHSLEVASIGRSLGKIVGKQIADIHSNSFSEDEKEFYNYELASVISAACLAHDIGNPPFGHSGESAISTFFQKNQHLHIEGKNLKDQFNNSEWQDLIDFEGNANALRVLTTQYKGRTEGGFRLTFPTLASIVKYPCESSRTRKNLLHNKKYGFFQFEKKTFKSIADSLGMIKENPGYLSYCRHPFVYLVEAADDICYRIIDFEDAHRLKILSTEEVIESFRRILIAGDKSMGNIDKNLGETEDKNEKVSFLRAMVMNLLTLQTAEVFMTNEEKILSGTFDNDLVAHIPTDIKSVLEEIEKTSYKHIYNHQSVVEIELAGYRVLGGLLEDFVPALLSTSRSKHEKKLIELIPEQFKLHINSDNAYARIFSALDFISGMTDIYAVQLYRKIRGISLG